MINPLKLLDRFLDLAAERNRFFLYEHELFYILDCARVPVPENIYMSYSEDPEEKFKMKLSGKSKRYVIKIVSDYFHNKLEIGGIEFGLTEENIEEAIYNLRIKVVESYCEWVKNHPEKALERYTSLLPKEKKVKLQIFEDIKGVLIVDQVYFPKVFGSEVIFRFENTKEPLFTFGDYNQYKNGSRELEQIRIEKDDTESLLKTIIGSPLAKSITGDDGAAKLADTAHLQNIVSFFASVAHEYSALNPNAKWHIEEFTAIPCVCFNNSILPVDSFLKFRPS